MPSWSVELFNFVGKLLGPKGNSLKRLQEDTMTKMAILGRGSMRDKHKEEELRCSGDPKFSHLSDDLHVEITAFAPPAEAHARIAYALAEVRRFLVPDYNDEIRQEQMWEMQILNTRRKPGDMVTLGDSNNSTASSCSNGSMSPSTPPPPGVAISTSPPPVVSQQQQVQQQPQQQPPQQHTLVLTAQHPALRGIEVITAGSSVVTPTPLVGRKRPLLPGGARPAMSPTKRTVLSILARARAAQAKDLPDYQTAANGRRLVSK
ncbi:KH domain-containing, RNA-binding, signal transduction-associated protein 2-like [Anabrus simplex]|uniref:KH domain-containing, RNA-binding, signal transduction-associated protein 2-like n=1 Tax=Anabrus simplex TaxID=316456 RepID=UPI0035A3C114